MQDARPDRAQQREILEQQLRLLEVAHPDVVVTGDNGIDPRVAGEPFGYLFREGRILVRPELGPHVMRFATSRRAKVESVARGPLLAQAEGAAPTALARLAGRSAEPGQVVDLDALQAVAAQCPVELTVSGLEPQRGVPELCAAIRQEFGLDDDGGPVASPHHLFFMAPKGPLCPASEPLEVGPRDRTYPPRAGGDAGCGVEVAVLDSGFIARTAKTCDWLAGVVDWDPDPVDLFDVDTMTDSPDRRIDPYAGHGTFIAGVIGRLAPGASLHVRRLDIDLRAILTEWPTFSADIVDELHLADHIRAAIFAGQRVISVSAGGPTLDDLPPLSFTGMEELFVRNEAVLVAAAGNESSDQPFWPAALDWTLGVGALDAPRAARADYSNFGTNATVYAPGTDIVNAFTTGTYECIQPPDVGQLRHFHGRARWSGTSFATPVVAGLVAARMAAQGESAPQAAAALVAVASTAHVAPGVGPVLDPAFTDLGV